MGRAASWVLAAVVGIVVVAALVTVLVSSRHPADLDPGSPEAAVQDYLDAVLDGDSETAVEHLAPGTACDVDDFDDAYIDGDVHVSLRDAAEFERTARVDVSITSGSGEMIPTEWTEEWTFRLRRTADGWLITGIPWPLFECEVTVR